MNYYRSLLLTALVCALTAGTALPMAAADDEAVRYVTEDFAVGFLLRPAQLFESRLGKMVTDSLGAEAVDQIQADIQKGTGLKLSDLETVLMLVDATSLRQMAGMPDERSPEPDVDSQRLVRNNMKQIMLAMHNFHEVYRTFPDQDGDREQENLSWRVHLLPFLEQAPLYEQFNLDEPWDSEHNKALIAEMPDVFKSIGVEEEGRTAIHGVAGEKTLMSGDGPVSLRNIVDGTSNTIALVQAGADKADIWTKPGAVKLKEGRPTETLGDVGPEFLAALADGSVRTLSSEMAANDFKALVGYADKTIIRPEALDRSRAPELPPLPAVVLHCKEAIDQKAVLSNLTRRGGGRQEMKLNGLTGYTFGDYGVVFPDERRMVAAPQKLLAKMLNSQSATGVVGKHLAATKSDLAVAINLQQIKGIRKRIGAQMPLGAMVESIELIQVTLDLSGEADSVMHGRVNLSSAAMAGGVGGVVQGGVEMLKVQLRQAQKTTGNPVPELVGRLVKLLEDTTVKVEQSSMVINTPRPDNYDRYVDDLKPFAEQLADIIQKNQRTAAERRKLTNLRMIGLAFHNYHDVHSRFPRFDGDAQADPEDAKRGLSWRVQLLPMLGHVPLYNQFELDEPWDSEANKKLIEKMPNVFRIQGVEEPGKTSLHVFIGDDTLFGDGTVAPRIQDTLDGTSNTLMVVEAGADKAEVWTKPGGLKFDQDTDIKVLGNIGEQFRALFVDGATRQIPKDIDLQTFRRLIQHQDGLVVGEF